MPDIEREVRRLLREDNHAIDVKWEVIVENDKAEEVDTKVCVCQIWNLTRTRLFWQNCTVFVVQT